MPIVEIKSLTKMYDGKPVIKDINLEINKGEKFAILGPSGAGKTTLLRLINLLEEQTSGRILFDGSDIATVKGQSKLKMRRRMALVSQGATVFDMSVFENIAYGLKVRGVGKSEINEKVTRALEMVGLSGYENRKARTLSGGETQRVAFAMATVFEPELLLLDEPTANLDPLNEAVIEDIILKIKKSGITIILATHKQEEAISLADRIAVINRGEIEQIGKPEEIFYKPRTRFVADFVGTGNVFEGTVKASDPAGGAIIATEEFDLVVPTSCGVGDKVEVCIRPEEIMVLREDVPINLRHKNIFRGKIAEIKPHGGAMFRLRLENPQLIVDVPRHVVEKMSLSEGNGIMVSLKSSSCHVIA